MESVVEGLLYVQGDLGITLKDIERILIMKRILILIFLLLI